MSKSKTRAQAALDELWRFTGELFTPDEIDAAMVTQKVAPDLATLKPRWQARIDEVLSEATLARPADTAYPWHGKSGRHTEHLGYLLAEMQFLQRAYPGAQW